MEKVIAIVLLCVSIVIFGLGYKAGVYVNNKTVIVPALEKAQIEIDMMTGVVFDLRKVVEDIHAQAGTARGLTDEYIQKIHNDMNDYARTFNVKFEATK